MRFGWDMDGENINAPLLSFDGFCMAFSLFRRRHRSGISIHLHATTVIGVQRATVTAMVSIGSIVFSSLNTPSPFLSENNSSI